MAFGTTPLSTTSLGSNQFPVSAVAVPGEAGGNLTALEGGPETTDSNGNKTSPVSSYVKDGGDVAQGLTTDVAVTGDTAGTISAKLRGLNKLLGDIWDSTNHRIKVDGSAVTQPVSGTFWQATQPVSAASLPLPTGASTSAKQPALGTAGTASSDVLTVQGIASMTALKVDGSGVTQPVSGTFWQATQPVSGTITANQGGTWTVQPGNTANTTAWLVQDVAATSGGSTPSHTMSAASTNATSLKASAGQIYGFSISNGNAAARFFKLYNKASSPTVGTDTPVMTVQVPANGTVIRAFPVGLKFSTGIAWAATGAITDADTTTIGANDLSIDIDYL